MESVTVPKRKPIVGGNWKMNLHTAETTQLTETLVAGLNGTDEVDVIIYPPFPYLAHVGEIVADSTIRLGAQDFYHASNGAFTGEVSLSMLADLGVTTVLVGHSERRHVIGETDHLINAKLRAALEARLEVILCVGETIEQREHHQTDAINAAQTRYGLAGVTAQQMAQVTIAYEPVWAIGTGKTATPKDAEAAHRGIRATLATAFSDKTANAVRIQYGGSVKAQNAADLAAPEDVDGFLVGGASLKADEFVAIVKAAAS